MKNKDSVRISFTISNALLQKIDDFAKKHHVSRSAFFTYACMQILGCKYLQPLKYEEEINSK